MPANHGASLGAFREILKYRDRNALAHSYVEAILAEDGNLVEAMREFRKAISLDPTLTRAYMGLGVALARSGRTEEAESAMRKAVTNDPSNVASRYDLGPIEAAQGKTTRPATRWRTVTRRRARR